MNKVLVMILLVVLAAIVIAGVMAVLPDKYADNYFVKGALVGVIAIMLLKAWRVVG